MTHNVNPIVRQIIDRDCHVAMSSRDVIRHVVSKLLYGRETLRAMSRADRRRFFADCLAVHAQNRALCAEVMGGTRQLKPPRRGGKGPVPAPTLSGKELVRLMRINKVTIAALALRLGMTMFRVRFARERGLKDALAVRDWIQAITGTDPGPIPERRPVSQPPEGRRCAHCGSPLGVGELAFEYVGELFCSVTCTRQSRGWQ